MPDSPQERSVGELFGDLSRELSTLVRQELDLAKTEMSDKIATVGKDVGFLAGGGLIIYIGVLFILAAIALALDHYTALPLWGSTLLVGLVVAGVGLALGMKGRNELQSTSMAPEQTIETLKEDKEWAQQQMK